jgi:hypothetical protein
MDRRVIGERSDAVLRTAMPGDDTAVVARGARQLGKALVESPDADGYGRYHGQDQHETNPVHRFWLHHQAITKRAL